jgi:outer membrane receptor protein involved in Fe transport
VAPSANAAGGGAFTSLQPYPNFPMQTYLQGHPVAPNNARAANWDAYSTEGGPRSRYARDSWFAQAALRINYELSDDITLISLSKYSKAHLDAPSEQDGTDVPNLQMTNYGTLKTIFQELRLDGRAGDNLKWMVGGNFQQTWDYECQCYLQNNSSSSNISGPTVDHPEGLAFSFDMAGLQLRQKAKSKGVFGSLDYKLTPEFTVQASARYSTQKRHMQNCIITYGDGKIGNFFRLLSAMLRNVPFDSVTLPSYPGFYGDCVTLENEPSFVPTIAEFSLKENNLSWRLGAQWKPSNDLMLYANVTSGYKEGNFANITCVFVSQCVPARAEKVLAYEAGIKASLLDRSLDLTAAIFQMDYDNKQVAGSVLTPPFGYLTELVSVPKSKIKGAEAQMNWRPVRGLNLMAGLTYLDAKVSDIFVTAEPSGVIADRKGEALPGTPKWNATADISYDFPISDSLSAFVGGNMFYTSLTQAYFGVNPIYTNPAYTLFDARAGIEGPDGKWKLQFWGKNLTNKFYIRHTSSISDTIVRWTGMPRTYGATLSWRY